MEPTDGNLSESLRREREEDRVPQDWAEVVERARQEEENVRRRAGLAPSPVPLSKRRRPRRNLTPPGSPTFRQRTREVGRVASGIGRGLLAGLVGTVALTGVELLEQRLTRRPPSDAPVRAAQRMFGVSAETARDRRRLALLVHFGYGTLLGGLRGLLDAGGMSGRAGAVAHFGIVEGLALAALPALGDTRPVTEWGQQEVALDLLHHALYVGVTDAVYDLLEG